MIFKLWDIPFSPDWQRLQHVVASKKKAWSRAVFSKKKRPSEPTRQNVLQPHCMEWVILSWLPFSDFPWSILSWQETYLVAQPKWNDWMKFPTENGYKCKMSPDDCNYRQVATALSSGDRWGSDELWPSLTSNSSNRRLGQGWNEFKHNADRMSWDPWNASGRCKLSIQVTNSLLIYNSQLTTYYNLGRVGELLSVLRRIFEFEVQTFSLYLPCMYMALLSAGFSLRPRSAMFWHFCRPGQDRTVDGGPCTAWSLDPLLPSLF